LKTDCRTRTLNYYQIWLAEKLSTWLLSSGQDFSKKFLDSKHVLKVYFKPSRKNQNFLFLPLCSELVWLKILHLRDSFFQTSIYLTSLFSKIMANLWQTGIHFIHKIQWFPSSSFGKKILLYNRTHHLWSSTTELTLDYIYIPDNHDFLTKHFLPKKKLQSKTEINMYSTFVRNYWRTSDIFVIMTQLFSAKAPWQTRGSNPFWISILIFMHLCFHKICICNYRVWYRHIVQRKTLNSK
jgi:hypothetical protein